MSSTEPICPDKMLNGVCTKGKDCEICNKKEEAKPKTITVGELNTKAAAFVPKSQKKTEVKEEKKEEKIVFNLKAEAYVPKRPRNKEEEEKQEDKVEDEEDEDIQNQEELDMIENNMIEEELMNQLEEDDSEDEDKWYPKYQNCECCKGFVYKCNGEACKSLGQCFCKMKDDCDENIAGEPTD
ncbi:MAG: hypothetical protein MJ252_22850 [archaeon]|nr:hypothetical protein [archaeon]